jgi:hypothetical protein
MKCEYHLCDMLALLGGVHREKLDDGIQLRSNNLVQAGVPMVIHKFKSARKTSLHLIPSVHSYVRPNIMPDLTNDK